MRALILASMVAMGVAGTAQADVFRYINTNAIATNGDDQTFFIDNSLVIDERLYPGGSIGGSSLLLTANHVPPNSARVESGGEVYNYWSPTSDWSAIGITDYNSPAADTPVAYSSDFFIRFAFDGGVLASGGGVTLGGSGDYSFRGGDWTIERTSIAPVPLPGTAPLLLAGAFILFGLRRPGRARDDVLAVTPRPRVVA